MYSPPCTVKRCDPSLLRIKCAKPNTTCTNDDFSKDRARAVCPSPKSPCRETFDCGCIAWHICMQFAVEVSPQPFLSYKTSAPYSVPGIHSIPLTHFAVHRLPRLCSPAHLARQVFVMVFDAKNTRQTYLPFAFLESFIVQILLVLAEASGTVTAIALQPLLLCGSRLLYS